MFNKLFAGAMSFVLASTLAVGSAGGSAATEGFSEEDIAAIADQRGYLIVNASAAVETESGTFYPTAAVSEETLIVIAEPDGSLPGGISEEQLAAQVADRRNFRIPSDSSLRLGTDLWETSVAPMSMYGWSANVSGMSGVWEGGSYIGFTWEDEASYYFETAWFSYQTAVGEGLGYYRGYWGSQFGVWSNWYGLGSAGTGGGGAVVPWGNVAGVKKFRAQCVNTALCSGQWQ